ncbi:hypothetical protein BDV96DRAFT_647929 [Lophiotrema nucula]|uniref:Uncharacterized protein n=1 Tax=Lophiotrema nucula TaxID=690887 RepID=A0A6A5Z5J0_9PLEO|nr:hypothetical protein BDV96DRAFT_647929 [Lophiotrema nucula]
MNRRQGGSNSLQQVDRSGTGEFEKKYKRKDARLKHYQTHHLHSFQDIPLNEVQDGFAEQEQDFHTMRLSRYQPILVLPTSTRILGIGSLDTDPSTVEKNLEENSQLARRWQCILLLDEAQSFLSKLSTDDLKRNGLLISCKSVKQRARGVSHCLDQLRRLLVDPLLEKQAFASSNPVDGCLRDMHDDIRKLSVMVNGLRQEQFDNELSPTGVLRRRLVAVVSICSTIWTSWFYTLHQSVHGPSWRDRRVSNNDRGQKRLRNLEDEGDPNYQRSRKQRRLEEMDWTGYMGCGRTDDEGDGDSL